MAPQGEQGCRRGCGVSRVPGAPSRGDVAELSVVSPRQAGNAGGPDGHGGGDGTEPPSAPRGAERGRPGGAGTAETSHQALAAQLSPQDQVGPPGSCSFPTRCSVSTAKSLLFRFLPFLRWMPRYPVKDWLLGDIVSGFSVGIMHLPQGLAYALLAGLPPVTGLYSSFYPVFLYFFFGTSRHNSVGPFAVISVMIGSVTDSLLPSENFVEFVNGTNLTVNEARRDAARVELVATITVLTGIFQVALGLLQFGFVVTYLSDPLVRGYTTAASVHVLVSQLKNVFGVSLGEHSGPLSLFMVSGVQLQGMRPLLLLLLHHSPCGGRPSLTPAILPQIIVSTGISYGVNLNAKFGISVVGHIPSGLKPPVVPNVSYFGQVVGNAFAIAVVGYAICISLGKIFALKHGYKVDSNQELIALGLCNFLGGFFQCFAISCSMSRSLVQESTGGNSQMVWIVTFVATLMLNLDIGLGASVAFGLLTVIFRTQL
uniref:Solute carrier family 26 member 6 n=1 Tax=Aquila chrysaetos chrysaetos TaxID=223781 RepID=A0A663FJS2_AQUCH